MNKIPAPDDITFIFETYRRIFNECVDELVKGERAETYKLEEGVALQIEGPNPYYGKTQSGYVLEYYYGSPHKVHTTEGEWTFFRRNCLCAPRAVNELADERLAAALGLTLGKAQRYDSGPCGGEVGPFFRVNGTESFVVPPCESRIADGTEVDSTVQLNALYAVLTKMTRG